MKHGALADKQDRIAREALAESLSDWERLMVGGALYIVARGDTAREFLPIVENFETLLNRPEDVLSDEEEEYYAQRMEGLA